MKKVDRQRVIYEVALGGIASAMAILLVWLSVVVKYGTIGFYVAACCAIMVPLTQRYYFASISAYIVSSLVCFAIVGDILVISGYVVYFAPMAIISAIMIEKKVKWFISYPVKVIYINLALAFLYYVAGSVMISADIIGEIPYWAVAIVGTIALVLIDILMTFVYDFIKRKTASVIRKKNVEVDNEIGNPFEDIDELAISKCTMADLNNVVALCDKVVLHLTETINYPKWRYKDYPSYNSTKINIENGEQYKCEKDGKIVGAFVLNKNPQGAYSKAKWSLDIEEGNYTVIHALMTDNDYTGEGIGSKMVEWCIQESRRQGAKAIRLDVVPGNVPAIKLYEKLGFKYVGEEDLERGFDDIPTFLLYEYNLTDND